MSDRVWEAIIACATEFTESPKTAVSVQDCRLKRNMEYPKRVPHAQANYEIKLNKYPHCSNYLFYECVQ